MSKRDKLRARIKNNPNGVTFSEIRTLLIAFGFVMVRQSGSHHIFEYDDGILYEQIIIPVHGKQVKPLYSKRVVAAIDRIAPPNEMDKGADNGSDIE